MFLWVNLTMYSSAFLSSDKILETNKLRDVMLANGFETTVCGHLPLVFLGYCTSDTS